MNGMYMIIILMYMIIKTMITIIRKISNFQPAGYDICLLQQNHYAPFHKTKFISDTAWCI